MTSFGYDQDYDAFEKAPGQAVSRSEMRLLADCLVGSATQSFTIEVRP